MDERGYISRRTWTHLFWDLNALAWATDPDLTATDISEAMGVVVAT